MADKTNKAEKTGEPRPRSGQITFVTGVHSHKGRKKFYITKRKLVFKKGILVEVGDTGPPEELDLSAAQGNPKKGE
jgi:hypothetical protein